MDALPQLPGRTRWIEKSIEVIVIEVEGVQDCAAEIVQCADVTNDDLPPEIVGKGNLEDIRARLKPLGGQV